MSGEIHVDGVQYVSAKEAALFAHVTRDYIARLARSGKIKGKRIGKNWYVDEKSLRAFLEGQEQTAEKRKIELMHDRRREYVKSQREQSEPIILADEPVRAMQESRIAHAAEKPLRHVHSMRHAVEQYLAKNPKSAHLHVSPLYVAHPAFDLAHKIAAIVTCFVLIFGTYAYVHPESMRTAAGAARAAFAGAPSLNFAVNADQAAAAASTGALGWMADLVGSFFGIRRGEVMVSVEPYRGALAQRLPQAPASPAPSQIINQPIIERVVESVRVVTGQTDASAEERLTRLIADIARSIDLLRTTSFRQDVIIADMVGDGIGGALDDVTITDSTWTGGTITDATITGGSVTATSFDGVLPVQNGGTGTSTYAVGDLLYADGVDSLARLPLGANGRVLKVVGGELQWAADTGGGGGAGAWATSTDELSIAPIDPSLVVIIGDTATSTTGTIFEVAGDSLFRGIVTAYDTVTAPNFTATSSAVNTFPTLLSTNATTTNLHITGLTSALLATDASGRVYATSSLSASLLDTSGDWAGTFDGQEGSYYLANAFSTTSAQYFVSQANLSGFSTTSANYWETQQTARTADDLTDNSIGDLNDVASMTEDYGDLFAWNGAAWTDFATSSLAIALSDTTGTLGATRGGTGLSSITAAGILIGNYSGTGWQQLATSTLGLLTTDVAEGANLYYTDQRVQDYLASVDKGFFFSTTSASHFSSLGLAWSTTSAQYFVSQANLSGFSTTSADYWKSVTDFFSTTSAQYFASVTDLFSTTSANYFLASSTTIPKTYTDNTWTGGNTFADATTTTFAITGVGSAILKTNADGSVAAAIPGTDYTTFAYLFPAGATTTLISFDGGLLAGASSTIAGLTTINSTSTSATTTDLHISGTIAGAGLAACNDADDKLVYNAATGQFGCGTDAGAGGGLTSLNGQTGSAQVFATSSDTNIGLTITSSGDVHTFTTSWNGTLAIGRGGTGVSSTPTYGQLLLGDGTGYALTATSSLGLPTFSDLSDYALASSVFAYPFPDNATSTLITFGGGLIAASSTIFGLTAINATTTNATTTNFAITGLTSALLATDANGRVYATTTIAASLLDTSGDWTGTFDGQEGSYYLANGFSTTSASYFSSLGLAFSTTSADAWKGQRDFFSTTSALYFAGQNSEWQVAFGALRPTTTLGIIVSASSTIGDGTSAGGLTILGTASTTRLAVTGTATSTFAGGISVGGSLVPAVNDVYSLGSPTLMWKDMYIGPGSLYVNGKKVIEDDANIITISTDDDQNLRVQTDGSGNVSVRALGSGNANLETNSGNININSTSGNINIGTTGVGLLSLGTIDAGIWNGSDIDISDYTNLAVSYPLTLTGDTLGLAFSTSSSNTWSGTQTFTNLITTNATTTSFGIGSETFTDLTGTGLTNSGGALTLVTSGDWTGTFDGQEGSYYLANAFSTTSAQYFLAQNQGASFSTTSADAWKDQRNFFSTTSASYFSSLGLAFSTTSNDYWKSVNDFFSTTSAQYFASVTDLFSTTSAEYLIAQYDKGFFFSTTSANYWETQQTARTADDLTDNSIGDLNDVASMTEDYGDLFAWNGAAWTDFATSSLAIALSDTTGTLGATRGGTGLSAITNNQLLIGGAGNTWTQVATSSLGLPEFTDLGNYLSLASWYATTTDGLDEGASNLYFTSQRATDNFIANLAATTSVASITTLPNLVITESQISDLDHYTDADANAFIHSSTTIPKTYTTNTFTGGQTFSGALTANGTVTLGTYNGPLQANNGVVSATTSIGVLYGGTGLTSAPTYGQLLLGNSSGGYTLTATSSLGLQSILQGTQGQVAYFSGTNTAVGTSSLFLASSGNVGVGTTSPYRPLSVGGSAVFGGNVLAGNFTATSSVASVFPYASTTALSATSLFGGTLTLSTALGATSGGTGQSSYAVGDLLYASAPGTLTRLPIGAAGQVLKVTGGIPAWGADISSGGGGGATAWSTTTDSLAIYPTDTSDVLIIGTSATSTANSILEVAGRSYFSHSLGIGTTSAGSLLAVEGVGNFAATGSTFYSALTLGSLTATSSLNVTGATTLANATTTNLGITGVTSSLLKTNGDGTVVAAVAGTDYLTAANLFAFPWTPGSLGNSTSTTLIMTNGLLATASSTIGDGTQAGGLTINGGATTTGDQLISGSLTVLGDTSIGNFNMDADATCGNDFHAFIGPVGTVGGDECAALNVTQLDINGNIIYRFGEANGAWAGEFYANASSVNLNTKTDVPVTFQVNGAEKMRIDGSSGNVGIGDTSPTYKLDVTGSAHITELVDASHFVATSSSATSLFNGNLLVNGSTTLQGFTFANATGTSATTTNFAISGVTNALLATDANGRVYATTTIAPSLISTAGDWTGTFDGQEGSYYLANGFSTTSASYFSSLGLAFSTTSNDYWKSVNDFFSTTSAQYFASVTDLFSTTSANYFVHSSTTIPKTYTTNTFTGGQTFSGALTANGTVTLGTYNGPLQANNGAVSATSSIGVLYGGTGLTSAPTYGQLLLGNSSGGYTLTATSSLGLPEYTDLGNYLSLASWYATTTDGLDEGASNLYYTDARATDNFIANLAATTSVASITSLPSLSITSSQVSDFDTAADARVAAGTTTIRGMLSATSPLQYDSSTGVFSILQSGAAQDGYLAQADWNTFNDKVSSSSLESFFADNRDWQITAGALTPTTTLGILVSASSTIGNGTQGGGLTINGGATTTGNAYFGGSVDIGTGGRLAMDGSDLMVANVNFANLEFWAGGAQQLTVGPSGNVTLTGGGTLTLNTSLNGPLQAVNGEVGATSTLSVAYGGTGLTTAPSYGQLLLGNSSGGYTLTATSSLGLIGANERDWQIAFGALTPTTTLGILVSASSTIGNGTQGGGLTINGGATTTGDAYFAGKVGIGTSLPLADLDVQGIEARVSHPSGQSLLRQMVDSTSASVFSSYITGGDVPLYLGTEVNQQALTVQALTGNIGIGTTSPYAKLSVVGQVVGANFTATTTAVNTFPTLLATNATTTSFGIGSETFTDLTGTGLTNSDGALTLVTSGDWTGTLDGQEGSYYLANGFSTTSADAWKDQRNFFSTTSASYFSSLGLAFSTTSNNYWKSVNDFFSTTSAEYFVHSSTTIPKTYTSNTFTGGQTFSGGATTTGLAITGITSSLLKTNANGSVVPAILGTDYQNFAYPFPNDATSTTLTFNGGLYAAASSTFADIVNLPGGIWNSNGNVGIGMTNPSHKLDVTGNARFTTGVRVGTGGSYEAPLHVNMQDVPGTPQSDSLLVLEHNGQNVALNLFTNSDYDTAIYFGDNGDADIGRIIYDNGTDSLLLGANDSTDQLILASNGRIGIGTASPSSKLTVVGEVTAANFTATTTAVNTFPTLLSTNATTTSFGINSETFTDLTGTGLTNSGGALTLVTSGDWTGTFDGQEGSYYLANSFSTTSASYFSSLGLAFSTTSNDYWKSVNNFFSTTSAEYFVHSSTTIPKTYTSNTFTGSNIFSGALTANGTFTIGTLDGPLQAQNGVVSATSTLDVHYGGTGTSAAPSYGQILLGNDIGSYVPTATSTLFSNSSQLASWLSDETGTGSFVLANSPTLAGTVQLENLLATGSTTLQNVSFVNATGTAATTTGLAITGITSSLLKTNANGSVVPAILGTDYQNFAFPWTPTSLGNSTSTTLIMTNGLLATASSTIGNGTRAGGLTISGGATTTGNAYFAGNVGIGTSTPSRKLEIYDAIAAVLRLSRGASSAYASVDYLPSGAISSSNPIWGSGLFPNSNNYSIWNADGSTDNRLFDVTATGNIGIGTTSPYARLSVAGQVVGANFTATTTAVNTFPTLLSTNATTTSFGINSETFTDLTGTGLTNSGGALTLVTSGDWTGTFDGQEGSYYLANAFSTTSASHFSSLGLAFSTTSAEYFLSQANVSGFSTTSAEYFVHSSTTIPKTYTTNTFTGSNTFNGTVTLGTYNGPLQANNGVVSATTSIGVLYGGTGLTSAPTYGQLLLGNSSGGYTLTATSSLGLLGANERDWRITAGALAPTTTLGILVNASSTIGDGTAAGGLTVSGSATTTGSLYVAGKVALGATKTSLGDLLELNGANGGITITETDSLTNRAFQITPQTTHGDLDLFASGSISVHLDGFGSSYFNGGNVGIGTTSPYAKLSVVGEAVASYFTATSTTATSTIAGGLNVGNGALAYDFSSGVTSISNLAAGALTFESDIGVVSWFDLPVTTTSTTGTVNSYSAQIDGSPVLTVYSEADGSGGVSSTAVGIGTTTPSAKLAVQASSGQTNPIFDVTSSSGTDFLSVAAGGFGTTTLTGLTISGSATSTSNVGFKITSGCYETASGECLSAGNFVDGAGNGGTNRVAYFSDNDTLTSNSGFTFDGSALSAPQIQAVAANPYFYVDDSDTTTSDLRLSSSDGAAFIEVDTDNTSANSFFSLYLDATERFRIDTGGNVGIGTSTPYRQLSVGGDAAFGGNVLGASFTATSSTASVFPYASTTVLSASTLCISTDCRTSWPSGGGSDPNWQIAFGALAPTTTLGILVSASSTIGGGTQTSGLTVLGGATTTGNAYFAGKIGIGTTTAPQTLSVYSNSGAYTGSMLGLQQAGLFAPMSNYVASIQTYGNRNGSNGTQHGLYVQAGFSSLDTEIARFSAIGSSFVDTPRMVVMSSGKVGIGTTTPSTTLTVHTGDGEGVLIQGGEANYDTYLELREGYSGDHGARFWLEGDSNAFSLQTKLSGAYTDVLTIPYAGTGVNNVGIGTTSPYAKLTVWGGATGKAFEITNSASTTLLSVAADGFGTTTLTGLTISGSATSTSNVGFNLTGGCFAINGTCIGGGGGSGTPGGSNGQVQFNNSGSFAGDSRFFWDNSTKHLGIGTTSPFALLSVHAHADDVLQDGIIFAVASSTANSTTTLFAVSNTGVATFGAGGTGDAAMQFGPDANAWSMGYNESDKSFRIASSTGLSSDVVLTIDKGGTTTFSNGIDLSGGCFAVGGTCFTGGGGGSLTGSTGQVAYFSGTDTAVGTSSLFISTSGNVGIGTSTPQTKLHVYGDFEIGDYANNNSIFAYNVTRSSHGELDLYNAATGDITLTTTFPTGDIIFTPGASGNVGIGTTSPYAKLSVVGAAVADSFAATSASATSTFAGGLNVGNGALAYDFSSGVTSISNLSAGALTFESDIGTVSWFDLPVTTTSTAGTVNSYSAQIDGTPVLTVYSVADGSGGVSSTAVGIGTTTPVSTLSVQGSLCVRDTGTCGTTAGTIYATNASISDIDLAENYRTDDQTLEPGEIVSLDTATSSTIKRAEPGEPVLGIISTKPGLLLGQDIIDGRAVALKGRIPAKVNMEGGEINVGDAITISSESGVGMKASSAAQMVAIALEATTTPGTIEVFIQNGTHFSDSDRYALNILLALASTTASSAPETEDPVATSFFDNLFARVGTWLADAGNGITSLFAKTIHAQSIYAEELCLTDADGETCINRGQLDQLLQTAGVSASQPLPPAPEPEEEEAPAEEPGSEVPAEETPAGDAEAAPPVEGSDPAATDGAAEPTEPTAEEAAEAPEASDGTESAESPAEETPAPPAEEAAPTEEQGSDVPA